MSRVGFHDVLTKTHFSPTHRFVYSLGYPATREVAPVLKGVFHFRQNEPNCLMFFETGAVFLSMCMGIIVLHNCRILTHQC